MSDTGYYSKELRAIKRSNRYRTRKIFSHNYIDMASNDYLSLSTKNILSQKAFETLNRFEAHGAKASMLVNGYHEIHYAFEQALCKANNFEAGVVVGSGFSANIAMIEALVRPNDVLLMDEHYHASGQLASKLTHATVKHFSHNDAACLRALLETYENKRIIVAVEGVYSMHATLCSKEIIDVANAHNAIIIMDEAHSSGVIGQNLLGIFDYYEMPIRDNYIKMGTLGKAYGGFGAYILASNHIIDYLINRAKPIIYATAPSLFETARAHEALKDIVANRVTYRQAIQQRQALIQKYLGIKTKALIVPIDMKNNAQALHVQEELLKENILVGAIRTPTVPKAIIRMIPQLQVNEENIIAACRIINKFR